MSSVERLIEMCLRIKDDAQAFPGARYFGLSKGMLDELVQTARAASLEYTLPASNGCSDVNACRNFQILESGERCNVCPNKKKARL